MPKSVDDIFHGIYGAGRDVGEATYETAKFIYNKQGKDLDSVAQEYLEFGGTRRVMQNFLKKMLEVTGNLIENENVDGQLLQSKQKILEKAEAKNVPLHRWLSHGESDWMRPHLELKKVDDTTYITEHLKFADCILEVYSGEVFFKERTQQEASNEEDQPQKLSPDSEESYRQELEEEIIYNLWKNQLLQCDL
ncbi:hypothetical protein [Tolypothrix sp. VBCCA 56010]|uniref:hypothetical protein n=1 Tax=Tolypothrix sp. VBCCA 56010 TaxID=3137731 RepID=UPI003D7F0365